MMQADRDAGTGVDEEHGVPLLLGAVVGNLDRYPVHPEDPLVPLSAGLYIGHRRREGMEAGDGRYPAGLGLGQGGLLRQPWVRRVVDDHVLALGRLCTGSSPRQMACLSRRRAESLDGRFHPGALTVHASQHSVKVTGPRLSSMTAALVDRGYDVDLGPQVQAD